MSDEQHRDEEPEVEAHSRQHLYDDSAADEDDDEVEAHVRMSNVRMDSPRQA